MSEQVQLLVCGNRYYKDYKKVIEVLDGFNIREIVHGGCTGADSIAGEYAKTNNIKETVFNAKWSCYGRAAGPIRNKEMVEYVSDDCILVAFDSSGKGTTNMIKLAKERGLYILVF